MDHKGFRFRLPRAGACAYRLFWNHGYGRDAVLYRSALPRTLTVRVGTGWNAGPGNSPAAAVLCDWLVPLYRVFCRPKVNVWVGSDERQTRRRSSCHGDCGFLLIPGMYDKSGYWWEVLPFPAGIDGPQLGTLGDEVSYAAFVMPLDHSKPFKRKNLIRPS